ncbi:unnamed protein product [Brachionus calyciflorus]|uniref:E3 ubiquitin-protein ligase CHFR n=1 Tax=Brachionus calyciflorus TaxID=104777 RepID=A0A813Z688_9BILA|nr:unnamed protein product [Brachionus calyciflorus]
MEKNWGTLTRMDNDSSSVNIKLFKDKNILGRAKDCDIKFENNFLSQKHCYIERCKSQPFDIYLVDQSSNGTLVNSTLKIHNDKTILKNGDVISLVYRKKESNKNIILKFELNNESLDSDKKILDEPTCSKKLNSNETVRTTKRSNECGENIISKEKKSKIEDLRHVENESVEKKEPEQFQDADDFTENITCTICNEIMYDCISLQPCFHSYCSGCYTEWMVKSKECPICRGKVERFAKNHIINNIIDAYLKRNPHKKRSEEDIKKLNEKNKITQSDLESSLKIEKYQDDYESDDDLKKNNHLSSDSDDDSERGSLFRTDEEDNDDEYEAANPIYPLNYNLNRGQIFPNYPTNHYFHAPYNNFNQPFRFTCRQCPQNKHLNQNILAPEYTCTPFQNHLLCQCCLEAFPDRNNEINRNSLLPKQNCSMCLISYCNLYWGCNKGGCKKCLIKFKDYEPDDDCLNLLINENKYESQLFSDWLVRNNLNLKDIFSECIIKLKNGIYKLTNANTNDPLEKVVCRKCANILFGELSYQFRFELPNYIFFGNSVNNQRPDCYWGKECRTQKHNFNHSMKYNHVCERTKST